MKTDELYRAALEGLRDLLNTSEVLINQSSSNLGRYEADIAASSLILLCIRNGWAIYDLGQVSSDHYIAAATCARTAFETGAAAAWLLLPDEPFEREGRWLGWLKANERFYSNLANEFASIPALSHAMQQTANHNYDWRTAIEGKLPKYTKVVQKPNMPDILRELGFLSLYSVYRGISQVVHAEPDALSLVHKVEYVPRDPSETGNIFAVSGQKHWFGYFFDESSWALPIRMALWALMISLPTLLSKIQAPNPPDSLFEKQDAMRKVLERLQKSNDTPPN